MAFKLLVFMGILVLIAVLGTRAYRASVRGFEERLAAERAEGVVRTRAAGPGQGE